MNPNNPDKNKIENEVLNWSLNTFGKNFVFRKFQKETCIDVIYSFLTGTKNYILEAPTGSGKSITAMIIGGVLSTYYGKRGYVLISDLSLIQQYENDINKYLYGSWGVIKGQDNYRCNSNGLSFKLGDCQMHNKKNYDEIPNEYECGASCEYLCARKKAQVTKMTVCTYNFWFTYQNMINTGLNLGFGERDFIICDEGHKLVDIIQSIYSIRLSNIERNNIDTIKGMMSDKTFSMGDTIQAYMTEMMLQKDNPEELVSVLKKLRPILDEYYVASRNNLANIRNRVHGGKMRAYMNASMWLRDYGETIEMFVSSVSDKLDKLVVTYTNNGKEETMLLNSLDEKYLMNKYFYPHFKNCLYMSATIGDPVLYANNCHMDGYKYSIVDSTFDFSKSPIFYCPDYKMSYSTREYSFPHIINMCNTIINMFSGSRGCILTSSYDMSKKIYDGLDKNAQKRVLLYNDSKDKREVLNEYKYNTNSILIGPSLFDGLSFNDDLCRFLIIAKVPYPDLKSEFIKKKASINYNWYAGQASLSVIQGVGRGVRSETDWCYSFILDGCFENLYKQTYRMYGTHISSRMIKINEKLEVLN